MKGTFSRKVTDAIKIMHPRPAIAIHRPIQNNHIAEIDTNINSTKTSSNGFLQFPTPIKSDAEHSELKRQVAAIGGVGVGGVGAGAGAGVGAGAGAVAAVDQHTVPYGEQTGLTKYAPMPKSAGTAIATRSATPQYPPFPFSIATTYLGAPTVQYTDMLYATWTANSIENTVSLLDYLFALCYEVLESDMFFFLFQIQAAPAPTPTLDKRMQTWLERWKD